MIHEVLGKKIYNDYLKCLNLFWKGKSVETIDFIGEQILELESLEHRALFYRLWIEQLADLKDRLALEVLEDHIRITASIFKDKKTTMALRGLIYLELDRWDACQLFKDSIAGHKDNAYCLEFEQRYHFRATEDLSNSLTLFHCEQPVVDYFHWNWLFRQAMIEQKASSSQKIMKYLSREFPHSPFSYQYKIHHLYDQGRVEESLAMAKSLHQMYPHSQDTYFLYGYLLLSCEKVDEAIKIFSEIDDKVLSKDCDILSLMAYCYQIKFRDTNKRAFLDKALSYYTKAEIARTNLGLPAIDIQMNSAILMESKKTKDETASINSMQYWLINLPEESQFPFLDQVDSQLEYLSFTMGRNPGRDDLVFVTVPSIEDNQSCRLVACYQVISARLWNPLEGYQVVMKRLQSFKYPLSVAVDLTKKSCETQAMGSSAPHQLSGVFSLTSQNLQAIVDRLEQLEGGESQEQELIHKINVSRVS